MFKGVFTPFELSLEDWIVVGPIFEGEGGE